MCVCNWYVYSLVNGYLSLIPPLESQICHQESRHMIHLEPWTTSVMFPLEPYTASQTYIQTYIHTYIQTYIHRDRQTDRQTDGRTDEQTDGQTDRQTDNPLRGRGNNYVHVYVIITLDLRVYVIQYLH